jgi:predicted TIM-barrel fold metal-dependent hydrolase
MIHQGKSQKTAPLSQYPAPMFEFLFDTARAVINMFLSGVITRCPDITFSVPHCGGTLAPLLDRVAAFSTLVPAAGIDPSVNAAFIYDRLKEQFFFDMAGVSWPNQAKMLAPYVGTDQLLYGSDYPFTPHKAVVMLAKTMDSGMEEHWPDEEVRRDVYFRNAERLLLLASSRQ